MKLIPKVVVLTYLTSPYQVELFNAVHAAHVVSLQIIYLYSRSPIRNWRPRTIEHPHIIVADDPHRAEAARSSLAEADVAVFNFYNHRFASASMSARARCGRPWCFWGERPGYRGRDWLGRWYRRWKLAPLHRSRAPIWGIGEFAVRQYRREFGHNRKLFNVSYYSNLERFVGPSRSERAIPGVTTFLFSGALIHRKGVDVLAKAFGQLAAEQPKVRLRFLGEGPLRSELERRLRPCADRVEFVGFRDWDELPAHYRQSDVLCVPSRHDGWGLVVPEGLAAGLPVIATDRTGAALDLVEPGRNGWRIPAGAADALLRAMREAAAMSEPAWEKWSAAAVKCAQEHSLTSGVKTFLSAIAAVPQVWFATDR